MDFSLQRDLPENFRLSRLKKKLCRSNQPARGWQMNGARGAKKVPGSLLRPY
jgi:hypothetical protein